MRKFWWELIFALASLKAALIALQIEGITPADGAWWIVVAGFEVWNSLLECFLDDCKKYRYKNTAEWIEPTNGADSPKEWRECSHCGDLIDITFPAPLPKYCEECGAKMRNGGKHL